MSSPAQIEQSREIPTQWIPALRLAFRFCFVYFSLYCLTNQILGGLFPIPKIEIPELESVWPVRPIVAWTAAHVFGIKQALSFTETGSGDRTIDWVLVFCILVAALFATAIWTAADRRRCHYTALCKWFRLFIRFALGSELLIYGMDKAIPLQMPFPSLARLLEPFGNFSPMGVLWYSIGASPAYETFTGCAEMLGGILLFFPRTVLLGALISLADMIQVFALNMTYDVPVKLLSFHLILLSLFLLAPNLARLAGFFFSHRSVAAYREPDLFRTLRANRLSLVAQVCFAVLLIGANAYSSWTLWHIYGGGRPKSPLYGIWAVDQMSVDGQLRPPLVDDKDRWRRAIFDSADFVTFQHMDDSLVYFAAAVNSKANTIELTKRNDKNWKASLAFQRTGKDRLLLDGDMDKHKIHMQLQLAGSSNFLLVSRGFHWVQEFPFNR